MKYAPVEDQKHWFYSFKMLAGILAERFEASTPHWMFDCEGLQ